MARQVPDARDRIKYLSLGNELLVLTSRVIPLPEETLSEVLSWEAFVRYVDEVGSHARARFPDTKITVTLTWHAVSSPELEELIIELRDHTDVLAINYYEDRESVGRLTTTVEDILGRYPADWPVVFQELGFLAPPDDEQLQVAFLERAFRMARESNSRVPYLGFFSLHDWHFEPEPCEPLDTPDPCDPCEADCRWCGTANEGLTVYLSKAGLLRVDDTPKHAWDSFKALALESRNATQGP